MPSRRRLAVTTLGINTRELRQCEDVFDDAVRRQPRHLTEDEDGRALQAKALRVCGKLGDGGGDTALVLAAGILDGDHGKLGPEASLEQLLGDEPGRGHAHIEEKRVFAGGQGGKIEMLEARLLAARLMA